MVAVKKRKLLDGTQIRSVTDSLSIKKPEIYNFPAFLLADQRFYCSDFNILKYNNLYTKQPQMPPGKSC